MASGRAGGALLQLAGVERQAPREAALQRMPVVDFGLVALPAQEHETIAAQRVEVEQADVEILDQAAAAMDRLDAARNLIRERRAARLQDVELLLLRSVGARARGDQLQHA